MSKPALYMVVDTTDGKGLATTGFRIMTGPDLDKFLAEGSNAGVWGKSRADAVDCYKARFAQRRAEAARQLADMITREKELDRLLTESVKAPVDEGT